MTGTEFKRLRQALGLPLVDYALALGYEGYANNLKRLMRRYEGRGREEIPPGAAERAHKLVLDRRVSNA